MQDDTKQPGLSWSSPKKAAPIVEPPVPPATAAASKSNGTKLVHSALQTNAPMYAGVLVCGIIAGVFLATTWTTFGGGRVSGAATSTIASADVANSATSSKSSTTDEAISISDQPAGSSVSIGRLNIAKPTWVVVYVSREGKPGNALGARLFYPGDKQGTVGLLRDTARGQSYFVGLSVDNGDKVFSLSKDKPMADADGGVLWATFRAR